MGLTSKVIQCFNVIDESYRKFLYRRELNWIRKGNIDNVAEAEFLNFIIEENKDYSIINQ